MNEINNHSRKGSVRAAALRGTESKELGEGDQKLFVSPSPLLT